jgi:hypothetical protein
VATGARILGLVMVMVMVMVMMMVKSELTQLIELFENI